MNVIKFQCIGIGVLSFCLIFSLGLRECEAETTVGVNFDLSFEKGAQAEITFRTKESIHERVLLTSFHMALSGSGARPPTVRPEYIAGKETSGFVYSQLSPLPDIDDHWFGIVVPPGQSEGVVKVSFPRMLKISKMMTMNGGVEVFLKSIRDLPSSSIFRGSSSVVYAPVKRFVFRTDSKILFNHLEGGRPILEESKSNGELREWEPSASGQNRVTKFRLVYENPIDLPVTWVGAFCSAIATTFAVLAGLVWLVPNRYAGIVQKVQWGIAASVVTIVGISLMLSMPLQSVYIFGLSGVAIASLIPHSVHRQLAGRKLHEKREQETGSVA